MKVFLCHQMTGLSEDEVYSIRIKAEEYLEQKYGRIIIIDNYTHPEAPSHAGRLWHLGRSIQQLGEADAIYFCDGFHMANGCCIELMIAKIYNIPIIN